MLATNGHALAVVPCEVDPSDRTGALSAECVNEARRAKEPTIRARKRLADVNGKVMHRRPAESDIPYDAAIPKFKYGDKGTVSITLNASLLSAVAAAIGKTPQRHDANLVTITFEPTSEGLSPILVSRTDSDPAFGVVMPGRR